MILKQAILFIIIFISFMPLQAKNSLECIKTGLTLEGRKIHIAINKDFPEVIGVGWGDIVWFMPIYAEYLKQLGAQEVIVTVPAKLKPFFTKTSTMQLSESVDTLVYESIELADIYDALKHIANFDRSEPILTCPEELINKWDKIVKEKTQGTLTPVLFFTSVNTGHNTGRFPSLADFNYLTNDMDEFYFINAQFKGDEIEHSIRAAELDADFDKISFLDTVALGFAVVVLNGGYVVSSDTGALYFNTTIFEGKKEAEDRALCLMMANPDQRWRNGHMHTIEKKEKVKINKSCWFSKSLLIFQQTESNNWRAVIQEVKNYLKNQIKIK